MSSLIPWAAWINICFLRRAPQDVAHSPALARNMVLLSVLIDAMLVYLAEREQAVAVVLISLAFLLALPWLLLNLTGHQARYAQTLAALAGTGLVFGLLLLPLVLIWNLAGPLQPNEQPSALHVALFFVQIGLNAWRLMTVAHILRHAMDLRLFAAALFAIGWFILELSASLWLQSGTQ
ncbi:hypothetical protein [Pseudomarimonas arenosa]|uniref:Uncharacterized protein n=1 Tax=Pseudomarimonas arenosa TaxID=2774145 RepID=A0AAW3ZI64_9GAMM|nr:hypothetical protein [Pseudomarimonas arenosa]MBD8525110.1 hypothetical protein [Pseudomarimonas arenosa]